MLVCVVVLFKYLVGYLVVVLIMGLIYGIVFVVYVWVVVGIVLSGLWCKGEVVWFVLLVVVLFVGLVSVGWIVCRWYV